MSSFVIETRELAEEACELIERHLEAFTSHHDFMNRHLSAGFLARCLALMRGILALGDADLDELCAVLFRVLLEACLLDLYVLLGDLDVLTELAGDFQRNAKLLAERGKFETPIDTGEGSFSVANRVNLEQVAKKLGPLLEAAGDNNADATGIYEMVYRFYSTTAVHGVGTVFQYLVMPEDAIWTIKLRPDSGGRSASELLLLSALYTMYFAQLAFEKWGYSSNAAADLLARIASVADIHAPTSPERGSQFN